MTRRSRRRRSRLRRRPGRSPAGAAACGERAYLPAPARARGVARARALAAPCASVAVTRRLPSAGSVLHGVVVVNAYRVLDPAQHPAEHANVDRVEEVPIDETRVAK